MCGKIISSNQLIREAKMELKKGQYKISWSGSVNRWQKYGKDRLYMGKFFVNLDDLDNEVEQDYANPYGVRSDRIFNGERMQIGIRIFSSEGEITIIKES